MEEGTVQIVDNQIISNYVQYGGAAIYLVVGSQTTIRGNVISGNRTPPASGYGTAVHSDRASFTATANLIMDNHGNSILLLGGSSTNPAASVWSITQ